VPDAPQLGKFPREHCDCRIAGCRCGIEVLPSFVQALGITGSVLLVVEVNDEDSESMERKSVTGASAVFRGRYGANPFLHESENRLFVSGGGIVPPGVCIQILGTLGTVVFVAELDDTEPLPSIIGSKSAIGVTAFSSGA